MFFHYRTRGFVLNYANLGDTDQLFTVYTKDFGKLEILGKSIRKIKSKLRSEINLFYLSEIEFIQGKTYKTLTDAILINSFNKLRKNLNKLSISFRISEVFNNLIKGEEKDKKVWSLLEEVFYQLNDWKTKKGKEKIAIIYYFFFWNFLDYLGYQPNLYNCSLCQKKINSENIFFDFKTGGLICENCGKINKKAEKIEKDTIKIMRIIRKRDFSTLKKLKISKENFNSLKIISDYYLSEILGEIE